MDAKEEILFNRKKEYEEQQRVLLSKLMSEKGGMLTYDMSENEIEGKMTEFLRDMSVLDYKYVDVVRDYWGLDPEDNTALFGEDMENRWNNFIKNHVVKDNEGKDTIVYEDKDKNYRLIPNAYPFIENMSFVIENFNKLVIPEDEEVDTMPSVTILGIEGLCGDKYLEHNLDKTHKDFYITQIMILMCELFDVMKKYRVYLKEESNNNLFKILSEKAKEVF